MFVRAFPYRYFDFNGSGLSWRLSLHEKERKTNAERGKIYLMEYCKYQKGTLNYGSELSWVKTEP